jgi:hypothetical protein
VVVTTSGWGKNKVTTTTFTTTGSSNTAGNLNSGSTNCWNLISQGATAKQTSSSGSTQIVGNANI